MFLSGVFFSQASFRQFTPPELSRRRSAGGVVSVLHLRLYEWRKSLETQERNWKKHRDHLVRVSLTEVFSSYKHRFCGRKKWKKNRQPTLFDSAGCLLKTARGGCCRDLPQVKTSLPVDFNENGQIIKDKVVQVIFLWAWINLMLLGTQNPPNLIKNFFF